MIKKFNSLNERIVCMDATLGLNNKQVLLTTLLMIDEYGQGLPIAFCLSEKEDETTIKAFLDQVKKIAGNLNAKCFISDDASQYFNAWKSTFGDCFKFLCSWHVFKNWKQQLIKKINDSKKRQSVLNDLFSIRNAQNKESAEIKLKKLIKQLSGNKSTKDFGQYLQSYYLKRMDQWVYCHRNSLVPNTNMHLESLHRLIKVVFLSFKRIQKISSCIKMLKEVVEQKMVDRLVKKVDRKNDKKTLAIKEIHNKAESEIEKYQIGLFYIDDETKSKVYEVISPLNNKYYPMLKDLVDHSCEFSCRKCTVCPHFMSCTCTEFLVNRTTCKHIHMVGLDFDLNCVNLIKEEQNLNDLMPSDLYDNTLEDQPSKLAVEKLSESQTDKELVIKDLEFYHSKIGQLITDFNKQDDYDKLILVKEKLKRVCSSLIDIDTSGLEEKKSKKRKMERQNRFSGKI